MKRDYIDSIQTCDSSNLGFLVLLDNEQLSRLIFLREKKQQKRRSGASSNWKLFQKEKLAFHLLIIPDVIDNRKSRVSDPENYER